MTAPDLDTRQFAKLSKEYADLGPIVEGVENLRKLRVELEGLKTMMAEGGDTEMKALAESEFFALKERLPEMERQVQIMLLPKDVADEKNAILEVRAGTGGDEAALFAADL